MRCTALTALFLALLALFSTMAYAAPIAPQGAILNRQCSMAGGCRDASVSPPASGSSGSTDRFTEMSNLITQLLALMGSSGNSPSNGPQSSTTLVTTASTTAAPASNPTGA